MQCPNCKSTCAKEVNYCSACGTRLKMVASAVGKMIDDFRKRLEDNPNDADAHYNLALAYLEAADTKLAEIELKRVVELEPQFVDAQVRLARLLLVEGNKQEAKTHLEKAIEIEPENTTARKLLEGL